MAVWLSILALFSFGTGDFVGGIVSSRASTVIAIISREIPELLAMFILIAIGFHSEFRRDDVLLGMVAGLFGAVGLPLFFKALSSGIGVVAPIAGAVTAAVPVIVGLAGGDHLSSLQVFGMVAAILGIVLISLESGAADGKRFAMKEGASIAIFCGVAFGLFFVTIHHTSKASGLWPTIASSAVMICILIPVALVTEQKLTMPKSVYPLNVLGALLDLTGVVAFTYGTRDGELSVTAMITSLYPAVTVMLAWLILKERFDRLHQLGLGLSALALVCISAG